MPIADNLKSIRDTLPKSVTLVCVSKFHPNESILQAYEAGERVFGENKVQELCQKYDSLPKDIVWHFIGHLQTNKVKFLVPFVSLIHGVDSWRLLQEIDRQAAKTGRIVDCLLQVHIATEETKFGFTPEELSVLISSESLGSFSSVRIRGLMGMATFTEDTEKVRAEFHSLKTLFDHLKQTHFANESTFDTLSMGMSDDYPLAIEQGSTMVRIGSSIFGTRHY